MEKTCLQCTAVFEITKEDLVFYEKVSPIIAGKTYPIPPPTLCPDCRLQRRLCWRSETKLYHRKYDKTGKQIISMYSQDKPHKVYAQEEWWGDGWDPFDYGKSFDSTRPFFEQFGELILQVPRPSLICEQSENCNYCHNTTFSKNSYLCFAALEIENCYYDYILVKCRDAIDCLSVSGSELCYQCINSRQCYRCSDVQNAINCRDCTFCFDCTGCKNCIGCVGLRQKEFHVFNAPVSKDEFEKMRRSLDSHTAYEALRKKFGQLKIGLPHRASFQVSCEDCTGDHIFHSRRCLSCFEIEDCEDIAYSHNTNKFKDSMDVFGAMMGGELQYDNIAAGGGVHVMFSYLSWHNSDSYYLNYCHNSRDLFGCIGLRQKQYCILNTQYTKEEYEQLLPKIIQHMQKTGEWGQFLPVALSPIGYNESNAYSFYPLTRDECLARGWKWNDEDDSREKYLGPSERIPDSIADVTDDICQKILICEATGKPYKIIPQELAFYRTMAIPIPRKCPDQRHKERMTRRNPRKLWKRTCAKCSKEIQTTYAPNRPEKIYCEECYLKEVY